MKRLIVNRKITALIFTVMFLIYGITSLGSADAPTVTNLYFRSGGPYNTGGRIIIWAVFSEPVTVTIQDGGWLSVGLEIIDYEPFLGTIESEADYVSVGSVPGESLQNNVVKFRYTVRASDVDPDGVRIHANSINRFLSTITATTGGEEANYSHGAVAAASNQAVNAPTSQADALPSVSSEERARIAGALAMDRVIFNELRNATTDAHDWVELRNVSNADVTLDGWEVRIVTDAGTGIVTLPAGTVLPPGGLLLLLNTNPNAPQMPLSMPEGNVVSVVDAGLILPQTDFTLLLRSPTAWEDSAGNYFFGHETPVTAPPPPRLTTDTAWYRARPDALGYQAEAWVMSAYQDGMGYDVGVPEASALGTPGYPQSSLIGDVNGDGTVNILDLVFVASRFDEAGATEADVNGDGQVNIQDLVMVANRLGGIAAAPSAQALHASHVQQWVESAKNAVATQTLQTSVSEQPLAYERGIQVLEQLLATLVPKSTVLLANYPNPFNPETWIPYRLAKGSDVQLRIYDTQGRIVRSLDLGHQAAGVYQTRSRAAYWDGTNAMGESVASGLYFYTLTAGEFSATRRMLILK